MLAPWITRNGYFCIALKVGEQRTKYLVHRLVAAAFCPSFDPLLSVNHKDGDKLNNRSDNLEWVSLAENTQHQWRTGLVDLRGEKHPSKKLTNDEARTIQECMHAGVSPTLLSNMFQVSVSLCYKIKAGRRHT